MGHVINLLQILLCCVINYSVDHTGLAFLLCQLTSTPTSVIHLPEHKARDRDSNAIDLQSL